MSIRGVFLAAATAPATSPATAPAQANADTYAWLAGFTLLSIALMVWTGVFRPRNLAGPDRIARRGVAAGLLLVLVIGLCVWIFSQAFYASSVASRWRAAGNEGNPDLERLFTPRDYAVLSTVPPMIAFAVLLVGDFLIGTGVPAALGFQLRRVGGGLLLGILGIFVIGPWVLWSGVFSEVLFRRLHYHHPMEHDLLRSLGKAEEQASQIFIILGATVAAPLFEELLFRGHLQTLLRRGFLLLSRTGRAALLPRPPRPPEGNDPLLAAGFAPGSTVIPYAGPSYLPPVEYSATDPPPPLPAWPSWVAVALTSLLFMSVHPLWSWPPIFVLALGLGYLYERTGNLWAPITVHLLFNGLETLEYLILQHAR